MEFLNQRLIEIDKESDEVNAAINALKLQIDELQSELDTKDEKIEKITGEIKVLEQRRN